LKKSQFVATHAVWITVLDDSCRHMALNALYHQLALLYLTICYLHPPRLFTFRRL